MQSVPSLQHGPLIAFLGTTASMVALINSLVAGAGVAVFVGATLGTECLAPVLGSGFGCAVLLVVGFLAYQRWRFAHLDLGEPTWAGDAAKAGRFDGRSTDSR